MRLVECRILELDKLEEVFKMGITLIYYDDV